jgi:hypothetical protein
MRTRVRPAARKRVVEMESSGRQKRSVMTGMIKMEIDALFYVHALSAEMVSFRAVKVVMMVM